MRLLVTGADGQVGWELRRSLAPLGEVIAMDRGACDLSRPRELPQILGELKPDVIINAAAYTAVDKAEEEEKLATMINGTAVGAMAEVAAKSGALFIPADYVFDGTKDYPYSEDDPPCPINAYGRSKLAGERATAETACNFLILRTSWVYAARGRNFLKTVLRLAHERDELRIVSDQIGAPTAARDIADATALVIERAAQQRKSNGFTPGIFNLTAGGATSWCGFAQAILDQAKHLKPVPRTPKVQPISSAEYPQPAARPKNSRLAGARLRERFGIALPDWEQAMTLCMQDEALAGAS